MVENYDKYCKIRNILNINFYPEKEIGTRAYKSLKYKKEHDFCFHYQTLKDILFLKSTDNQCKSIVNEYHICKKNKNLLEIWNKKVIDFLITELNGTYYSDTIVYQNNKAIGVKPFSSKIYDKNPFIISKIGFENYIELMEILDLNKNR